MLRVDPIGEFDDAAIGQHRLDALDEPTHVAILERVGAGGIVGYASADRRAIGAGRIRSDLAPVLGQVPVQLVEYDAGLAGHCLGLIAQFEDAVHVARRIEDDPVTERFTGQAAAGSSRRYGQALPGRVLHHGHDVAHVARRDNALRHDAIAAGIRTEGDTVDDITKHITSNRPGQFSRQLLGGFLRHSGPYADGASFVGWFFRSLTAENRAAGTERPPLPRSSAAPPGRLR